MGKAHYLATIDEQGALGALAKTPAKGEYDIAVSISFVTHIRRYGVNTSSEAPYRPRDPMLSEAHFDIGLRSSCTVPELTLFV